jgi:arylsulfatase A-like enzyme
MASTGRLASSGRLDRRTFLKSAAFGATSLAVGCGGTSEIPRPDAGADGAPDAAADGRPDLGAGPDGGVGGQLDRAATQDAGAGGSVEVESEAGSEAGLESAMLRRPNLLFILADQWRAQAGGWAGDPNALTPQLDRFARESVTFAHAVSCTPVCSPYRATLLTSRYPTENGVFVNDVNLAQDPHSLASMFKGAGYDTGYIGKWHLDGQGCRLDYTPPERRQGFGRWAAIECTHDYNNSPYYAGDDGKNRLTWSGYDAIAQTREMQRWLTDRDPSTPFCYFLSWGPPHDPYNNAPAEFASQFAASAIQLRPNVPQANADGASANLAGYYAHMAALDRCVGDLLGTLGSLGIADDTIVVFTSDHGDMHGSQGQFFKQQPWDESILVPFFLRYPARLGRSAQTIPMQINTPDIMPTLLGLAGQVAPSGISGRDLSPVLRKEAAPDDEGALIMCVQPFSQFNRSFGGREYRGVRTGRFTYVRSLAGPWLLYDNDADPYQLINLVGWSDYATAQSRLDDQLTAKLAAIADPFREGTYYVDQWGYTVDPFDGSVPYSC